MDKNDKSYQLPTETVPSLAISDHHDDLVRLTAFLASRGIETNNTRIDRYRRYLERAAEVGPQAVDSSKIFKSSVGPPLLSAEDWFLYVLREVHELMWILKGIEVHVPIGIDAKLRTIVGGRDFAALDADSQSRNAQFELRIASYFCQSGCEVDVSTDTDIVATSVREIFFIECKRVASSNQFAKRLAEARTQLARRMPRKDGRRLVLGCVAADVTKIAFTHNGLTWGVTSEHVRDVIQEKLVSIADDAERQLSFDSCRKLLNYWLQIHIASLAFQPGPTPMTRFSSYHIGRPKLSRKEFRALNAFYNIFESVSRHDDRSSTPEKLTPRTSMEVPAGSTFSVNTDEIVRLLAHDPAEVLVSEQFQEIASLNMNGRTYAFNFLDVVMLGAELVDEWKRESAHDAPTANLSLVCRMFLRRYPYEELGSQSPNDADASGDEAVD